jgi:gliding motility-associated-like protein
VAADPDTIFLGDTTQMSAFLSGATVFQWEPTAFLSDPNIANPLAFPVETTIFSVEAPISATCTARAEVQVVVLTPSCEEPFLFFPTGFSPNGDGQNDALKLESQFATSVYWAVFNRWGEKVFEAHSIDDSWDGTYRGVEQPVETYGYYLQVRCLGGQEVFRKGNVTLLR